MFVHRQTPGKGFGRFLWTPPPGGTQGTIYCFCIITTLVVSIVLIYEETSKLIKFGVLTGCYGEIFVFSTASCYLWFIQVLHRARDRESTICSTTNTQ